MRGRNLAAVLLGCYLVVGGCANVPEVETINKKGGWHQIPGSQGFISENQALESVAHWPGVVKLIEESSQPVFFKIIGGPTSKSPAYTIEVLSKKQTNGSELLLTVTVDARTGEVGEKRSGP